MQLIEEIQIKTDNINLKNTKANGLINNKRKNGRITRVILSQ